MPGLAPLTRVRRAVARPSRLVRHFLRLSLGAVFLASSSPSGRPVRPADAADAAGFAWPGWQRLGRGGHESHRPLAAGLTDARLQDLGTTQRSAPNRGRTRLSAGVGIFTKPVGLGVVAVVVLTTLYMRIKKWFDTPKRPYGAGSVGDAYDNWTRDGVLEHYWGEHIHMGSYTPISKQKGYAKKDPFLVGLLRATLFPMKDFKEAKIDFTNEMIDYSRAKAPKKILDVGCGIGGSSRILAKRFPDAEVTGITLSPEQAARAGKLAKEAGLNNVKFEVVNALDMSFADNTFDLVWGCESGEHMPDKQKYIQEMVRVLAPGGNLVVATWCERDPTPPFTNQERNTLDFLYAEWSHPFFISLNAYKQHMLATDALTEVETDDWTEQTLPSWRHSVWVGVWSPWFWLKIVVKKPLAFLGFLREVYTLERYHRSMVSGLMVYGMMRATKKKA